MRRIVLASALATGALALVAAGCGGSDGDSSAAGETTAVETTALDTTMDETTTEGTATDTTSTETTGDLSSLGGKCKDLVSLSQDFSKAFGNTSGGNADFSQVSAAFDAFADKVPEEIRADFKTLAEAFSKYAEVFKGIDLKSGQAPSPEALAKLQQALSSLNQTEVQAASNHINAWVKANC